MHIDLGRGIGFVTEFVPKLRREFAEGVGERPNSKAFGGADEGVLPVSFALCPPTVREKVVAGGGCVTRVGEVALTVGAICPEGQIDNVPDARAEGALNGSEVARIFSPCGSEAHFHRITGRNSSEAHAVTLCESIPVGTIFGRGIDCSAEG